MTDDTAAFRAEFTNGLRSLADFIDSTPDLPLPDYLDIQNAVLGENDAAERAEVDRIAALLGTTAVQRYDEHHYTALRRFGPRITFSATAITDAYMRLYKAKMEIADKLIITAWDGE
ncbi:hypothetical protein [Nonomuraea typhae]|uniref:Uncharacterized protein n=1 Tax=Nonomuraea typhae TaxID=2603600 RepID=A0ABW7YJV5_9ACTN